LNYNNNNDTIDCVSSVYNSENIELPFVVVINNSDNESHLVDALGSYTDLKVLFPGKNLGFSKGNNFGIKWALENLNFDFLMVLNNDTLLQKDTLHKLISYANNNPEVTLFAPCIITAEEPPRIWYAGGDLKYSRMTARISHIEEHFGDLILINSVTRFASGCAFMISHKMYDFNEPLFDPNFFIYDEDVELSLRLLKNKKVIQFVSDAIVIHKCQGSQHHETQKIINQLSPRSRNLLFYLEHTIRNRYYIISKHFHGFEKFRRKLEVTFYWILKSCEYALHFNLRASSVVINKILKYSYT
jgi:GT2 family glycosyltransferase